MMIPEAVNLDAMLYSAMLYESATRDLKLIAEKKKVKVIVGWG
jgi:hypothetical protein